MTSLRSIRPLAAASMRGVVPSSTVGKAPKVEWVDPATIYVEDEYQRGLSAENSTTLIRKIVANFDWSRFKLPICVRLPDSGNVLVCIDGQHTATAAATHPAVPKIPVLVVSLDTVANRAEAFVGHNKDRLALTPMAIYRAELAAGDQTALAIERACKASGAEILQASINLRDATPPGKTIAIGTLRTVLRKGGEEFLARVLRVLVRAGRGPVKAGEIAATAALLKDYPEGDADWRLREVVASKSAEKWDALARAITADGGGSAVDALVTLWARELGVRVGKQSPARGRDRTEPVSPAPPPVKPASAVANKKTGFGNGKATFVNDRPAQERAAETPKFSGLDAAAGRRRRAEFDPDAPPPQKSKQTLQEMLQEAVRNTAKLPTKKE